MYLEDKGVGGDTAANPTCPGAGFRTYLEDEGVGGDTSANPTSDGVGLKMYLEDKGVGGDTDVEGVWLAPAVPLDLALLGAAKVGEQLEGGAPLLELHLPVQHD